MNVIADTCNDEALATVITLPLDEPTFKPSRQGHYDPRNRYSLVAYRGNNTHSSSDSTSAQSTQGPYLLTQDAKVSYVEIPTYILAKTKQNYQHPR